MSRRPSAAELLDARERTVTDLIRPGLTILFCGINPSLYSAAVGHHFARPGNRFWPALQAAGFTPQRLRPEDGAELLRLGYGISNIVPRATATAAEVSPAEFRAGGQALMIKLEQYRPEALAVLGITAYRLAFARPRAVMGRQPERLGEVPVWVLPNPSGLNAHYQLHDLARTFSELRSALASLSK